MKKITFLFLILISNFLFAGDPVWTCIKEDGSTAFTIAAKWVDNFSEGLAAVRKSEIVNNTWVYNYGFVDKTGKEVIGFKYDKVKGKGFVNGFAWVKKRDAVYWTLIDKAGKEVPIKNYNEVDYLYDYNNGIMAVYSDKKMGFINQSGEEIIPCKYTGAGFFENGLACVAIYNTSTYGFMNLKGEMVIPMQYKQAGVSSFGEDGVCRAMIAGKTVLINRSGKVVFKTAKGNIQMTTLNKIGVFTKSNRTGWGLLDYNDNWVIQPIYDNLSAFNEKGIAEAVKNDLAGLIDSTGKVVLDFKYDMIYHDPIKDGFYMGVYKTEKSQSLLQTPKDYFTADLEPLNLPGVAYIYHAQGEKLMRYVAEDNLIGYLNRDFKFVISAKYTKAKEFSDGMAWVQ